MPSEFERGHHVSGARRSDTPDSLPNEAANAGLRAVEGYLKARGLGAEHVVVLVRTMAGDRTGGTAVSVAHDADASAQGLGAILLAHARAVLQTAGLDIDDIPRS